MNHNINRIGIQPARPIRIRAMPVQEGQIVQAGDEGQGEKCNLVGAPLLSPTPRNLHILWQEFQFGIGGRKAAKLFTREERGRCKYTYHRRKVVWDRIQTMIREGHTSETAIDTIYDRFGREKSVTKIINEMRRQGSSRVI
jgi:Transcriptional activator of glycolytic enzymes